MVIMEGTLEDILRFTGRAECTVSPKKRVSLPAFIRNQLQRTGEKLYSQDRGDEKFIYLLPEGYVAERYEKIPSPMDKDFTVERLIGALSSVSNNLIQLDIDGNGRIMFSKTGRDFPESRRVYYIGCGEYVAVFLGSKREFEGYVQEFKG